MGSLAVRVVPGATPSTSTSPVRRDRSLLSSGARLTSSSPAFPGNCAARLLSAMSGFIPFISSVRSV